MSFSCAYYPPRVQSIIANGTGVFIGEVDENTVLKYPAKQGSDPRLLEHEYRICTLVGSHPNIIAAKEINEQGLYLERAPNGTVYHYLSDPNNAPTVQRRVAWCRELLEAVQHLHKNRVIHTDLNPSNVLLDKGLSIKLADLQSNYTSADGKTLWFGERGELCRYYCPRDDDMASDVRTDLFALGSTIHFIMLSVEVFPDIISGSDEWYERVQARFANKDLPTERHACAEITRRCWQQDYASAEEVLQDVIAVEQTLEG
ncbi:hypothetical protein B0A55_00647 [Friedmanniomyces simplex]|uniref:Protein kinase domain-containing protein n=1 Tax=Friedmanniomyces simplex TaxID=329884 RepID=A0A4U0Y362_9PEZI|nr:hypothetical protein B0A55_00647 [Friedmanniomyces simplex]